MTKLEEKYFKSMKDLIKIGIGRAITECSKNNNGAYGFVELHAYKEKIVDDVFNAMESAVSYEITTKKLANDKKEFSDYDQVKLHLFEKETLEKVDESIRNLSHAFGNVRKVKV